MLGCISSIVVTEENVLFLEENAELFRTMCHGVSLSNGSAKKCVCVHFCMCASECGRGKRDRNHV